MTITFMSFLYDENGHRLPESQQDVCNEQEPDGDMWFCSLHRGHSGPHQAHPHYNLLSPPRKVWA